MLKKTKISDKRLFLVKNVVGINKVVTEVNPSRKYEVNDMFNFFKKKEEKLKEKKEIENSIQKGMKGLQEYKEVDKLFSDYLDPVQYSYGDIRLSHILSDDEIFSFIYKTLDDMKKTMIISSYLKQIEIPIDIVKKVYSIDDYYINNLTNEILPSLKVAAYKYLKEEVPNISNPFFPDIKPKLEPVYEEFIDRIDYYNEIKRNRNKINNDNHLSLMKEELLNNPQVLLLLNAFDIKDTLIIASNLGIVNIYEDELHALYDFDENRFSDLLTGSNMLYIEETLRKRIEKLDNIPIEVNNYFDYEELSNEYNQLLDVIDDAKLHMSRKRKR